jgi:hypothetical protein
MWGGGAVTPEAPGAPTVVGNVMTYTHTCDIVTAVDSTH